MSRFVIFSLAIHTTRLLALFLSTASKIFHIIEYHKYVMTTVGHGSVPNWCGNAPLSHVHGRTVSGRRRRFSTCADLKGPAGLTVDTVWCGRWDVSAPANELELNAGSKPL